MARDINFNSSSGNIESVNYEDETGELVVVFRGGRAYTYTGVPPTVADGFSSAPSAGSYLNDFVKGLYPFSKA